jgi:hypothetical protein
MHSLQIKIAFAIALIVLLSSGLPARAQSPDAVADLAARINRERITRGLVPYALNAQLTAAAQAHANDIGNGGSFSHTGSDGSSVFDRVARTGYGAYSWGRRLGENWAWYRSAETAVALWMDSAPHRNNILHAYYREFGIGIASRNGNFVFVIDFGAQPNALPFFINDAADETNSLNVTLTFSSEEVMPAGDGANNIGRATEMLISNSSDFTGAQWQPFEKRAAWSLAPGSGKKTVYVKYRDARGRTATASDSIIYNPSGDASTRGAPERVETKTPTRANSPTPRPSATRTPRPTAAASPTARAIETPTQVARLAIMPTPTATEMVLADTPTPPPRETPAPELQSGQSADWIALGGAGIGVMLAIFLLTNFLATRYPL